MSIQRIVVLVQMLIVILLIVIIAGVGLLLKKRLTVVGKDCMVVQHTVPRRGVLVSRGLHRNNWTRVYIAAVASDWAPSAEQLIDRIKRVLRLRWLIPGTIGDHRVNLGELVKLEALRFERTELGADARAVRRVAALAGCCF